MIAAWALLFFGVVGLILCTMESFTTLSSLTSAPKANAGVVPSAGVTTP
jgi:hypothetical protein